MKKTILLTSLLAISFAMSAKNYKVYNVTGNVSKKTGSTWTALTKNQTVSDSEMIKINPSSSLKVIDAENRQVYNFSKSGEFKLDNLLKTSVKENSSLLGKIGAESKKQLAASNTKSHAAVGASKRALLDEDLIEALYAGLVKGFDAGTNVGNIRAEKISLGDDGEFYLELSNSSEMPLYANVFVKGEEGVWQTVYQMSEDEPALLVAPGATVSLSDVTLFELPGDSFAVVAFDLPFDGDELNDMFFHGFEPEEKAADNISIYFVK